MTLSMKSEKEQIKWKHSLKFMRRCVIWEIFWSTFCGPSALLETKDVSKTAVDPAFSVDSLPETEFGDVDSSPKTFHASVLFQETKEKPGPLHSTHLGRLMVPSPHQVHYCLVLVVPSKGRLLEWLILSNLSYQLKSVPRRGHPGLL